MKIMGNRRKGRLMVSYLHEKEIDGKMNENEEIRGLKS